MSDHLSIEYRELPEHPGYRIGNDGSVWSRWKNNGRGGRAMKESWHQLKPHPFGRRKVHRVILRGRAKGHTSSVHRLVLLAFVGPPPKGMVGCHRDDNTSNNRLDNLRWDTHKNNSQDAISNNRYTRGEDQPRSKLTDEQVASIRSEYAAGGITQKQLGTKYGVIQITISRIIRREIWKHI